MTIIVPMAGSGQRFVDAGYLAPKPLILLEDPSGTLRMIIEHVVGMFSPDDRFVFICNDRHLATSDMRTVLSALCPRARIVSMPPHKLGPVYTVMAAAEHIEDDEEIIVAYCDGAIKWDREAFAQHVVGLDGCILTHTGFHPHTLNTTKMAFIRERGGMVVEVQEKASFTDEPQKEHASSGVYYFRRSIDLKNYFAEALKSGPFYNGECYVTLVYNLLIRDGLRVGYYDTDVAILGTPSEVANYEAWATILKGEQVKSEGDAVKCFRYWTRYHGECGKMKQATNGVSDRSPL